MACTCLAEYSLATTDPAFLTLLSLSSKHHAGLSCHPSSTPRSLSTASSKTLLLMSLSPLSRPRPRLLFPGFRRKRSFNVVSPLQGTLCPSDNPANPRFIAVFCHSPRSASVTSISPPSNQQRRSSCPPYRRLHPGICPDDRKFAIRTALNPHIAL